MASMIEVARAFRAPIDTPATETVIAATASALLADSHNPSAILNFIQGALAHQARVREDTSKVFPATITKVRRIERTQRDSGKVFGVKVEITMTTTDKDRSEQEETITTGFVELHGNSDPAKARQPGMAWEMAHSLSVEQDARALEGRKVFVRKAFISEDKTEHGGAPRFIADIMPNYKEDPDGAGSARGGASSNKTSYDVSDIKAACREVDVKYHEDMVDLCDVDWSLKGDDLGEDIAQVFKFRPSHIDSFVRDFAKHSAKTDTPLEAAVLTLDVWL